jgi:hypothetical protein
MNADVGIDSKPLPEDNPKICKPDILLVREKEKTAI